MAVLENGPQAKCHMPHVEVKVFATCDQRPETRAKPGANSRVRIIIRAMLDCI